MGKTSNHAIVYGASGLVGWAVVNQLLSGYPGQGTFSKITAITNRPLVLSDTRWPELNSKRPELPELQLVSGIDLRRDDGAALADSLKQVVEDVQTVTHVYYLGMSPWSMIPLLCTNADCSKSLLRLRTMSRKSLRIDACSRMSSMPTTCSVQTCSLWHFRAEHG